MKFVVALIVPLALLVGVAVYDMGEAAKAKAKAQFGCRAPTAEGDVAVVTFSLRSGDIVAECHYATARQFKGRK